MFCSPRPSRSARETGVRAGAGKPLRDYIGRKIPNPPSIVVSPEAARVCLPPRRPFGPRCKRDPVVRAGAECVRVYLVSLYALSYMYNTYIYEYYTRITTVIIVIWLRRRSSEREREREIEYNTKIQTKKKKKYKIWEQRKNAPMCRHYMR